VTVSATRQGFVNRGLRLSYLDSAPGDTARPVVLLLHGFPDSAQMWVSQIQALHDAGYRCLAPDTVGCGQSQIAPRRSGYNARTIIEDHRELLRHLGIGKCHVVGHDWGAFDVDCLRFDDLGSEYLCHAIGHPARVAARNRGTDDQ
jgi:pimeloyl-ACP methyl ester carboxylesterase